MPVQRRRTAMKVVGGRVLRKNNWRADRGDVFVVPQSEIRLERRDPGKGFRHLVTVAQLRAMIGLLPEWGEVAGGLEAVVLDRGFAHTMGWQRTGVVAICAWEQGLWWPDADEWFRHEHGDLLALLGVEAARRAGRVELRWSASQARAFQLLHILPHEIGHHHDQITTRRQRAAARGEPYAERYAHRVLDAVWDRYTATFGLP